MSTSTERFMDRIDKLLDTSAKPTKAPPTPPARRTPSRRVGYIARKEIIQLEQQYARLTKGTTTAAVTAPAPKAPPPVTTPTTFSGSTPSMTPRRPMKPMTTTELAGVTATVNGLVRVIKSDGKLSRFESCVPSEAWPNKWREAATM